MVHIVLGQRLSGYVLDDHLATVSKLHQGLFICLGLNFGLHHFRGLLPSVCHNCAPGLLQWSILLCCYLVLKLLEAYRARAIQQIMVRLSDILGGLRVKILTLLWQ
jgi:hypothetical protein